MSTGAQRSAECGLYHKGRFLGGFLFFSMIPTVKLDLIPEIIVIAEPSGEVC